MTDGHSEADGIVAGALADRRMLAQIFFSLALVALADWLFYRHPVGWTLGAFGALAGLGVMLLGASPFKTFPSILLGACYFGLCLRAVIDPEPMAVLMAAPAGVALTLTLREGWTWSLSRWFVRGRQFLFGLLKSYVLAAVFALALPVAPVYAVLRLKGLRAWLIPLALGLLFLGLFALANPVIALAVSAVWKALLRLCAYAPSLASFLRLSLWLTVGALLWTLLRHRTRDDALPAARPAPSFPAGLDRLLSPEVIRNALIVFNALFAVQTALDLWYLWGGGALPQGLTYAGYAHRGAYPLVATALLAAAFVLATFREGSPSSELHAARGLVYVWLLQNIFLVASAGWRLWLYVSVFSLSRLRVAAGVWMYLVACGLIWIAIRIFSKRSNAWLVNVNLSTAVFVLMCYGCSAPNMFIADFNVRHCKEAGCPTAQPIDLAYLTGLGHDALPALVRLERQVRDQPPLAKAVRSGIDKLSERLDARLRDWRGVTIKRRYVRDYVAREYLDPRAAR